MNQSKERFQELKDGVEDILKIMRRISLTNLKIDLNSLENLIFCDFEYNTEDSVNQRHLYIYPNINEGIVKKTNDEDLKEEKKDNIQPVSVDIKENKDTEILKNEIQKDKVEDETYTVDNNSSKNDDSSVKEKSGIIKELSSIDNERKIAKPERPKYNPSIIEEEIVFTIMKTENPKTDEIIIELPVEGQFDMFSSKDTILKEDSPYLEDISSKEETKEDIEMQDINIKNNKENSQKIINFKEEKQFQEKFLKSLLLNVS